MSLNINSPAVVKAAQGLQAHEGRCWPTDEQHQVFHQKRALACLQAAGVGELVEALEASRIALDDWLNTYAAEHCDARRVCEAYERIKNNGGTLSYLADIQTTNRACLKTFTGSDS